MSHSEPIPFREEIAVSDAPPAPAAVGPGLSEEPGKREGVGVPTAPPWQRWEVALYLALILVALGMRLWDLGSRALHHDESLHAVYSWYLYTGRGYEHNPLMHGPFQFHGVALMDLLFGDSNVTSRLLAALSGTALVAMPLLLRYRLGRVGALATATLLAFSPMMLYFSRFTREDIYMAVWTLGLVSLMWRYLDMGRNRYLYLFSLFLALAFATKENTYILVAILGGFLFILSIEEIVGWLRGTVKLANLSRPGALLLLLFSLSLPMWSAGFALFQGLLGGNLVLANQDPSLGAFGIPRGDGEYLAAGIVVALFAVSTLIGLSWRPKVWLVCASIYGGVWLLLFTTFFTNLTGVQGDVWRSLATGGIGSGVWQSLGYWLAQQGVARGGQPWYYYFVLASVYEVLALLFALVATVVYLTREVLFATSSLVGLSWRPKPWGDRFTWFLVFWAGLSLLLYIYASEKMPWLMVHVALPLIVLSGRFLGDLLSRLRWKQLLSQGGLFPLVGMPLLLLLLVALLVMEPFGSVRFWALGASFVGGAAVLVAVTTRLGLGTVAALSAVGVAGLLFLFQVRAGAVAAYAHGDVPVEMLVYTQTAPDVPRIARQISEFAQQSGKGRELRITVDSSDGFAWPWAWYLRDYPLVAYPCYSQETGCSPPGQAPEADVLLLNANNRPSLQGIVAGFCGGEHYKHRWWFPEVYRQATPSRLWDGFQDRITRLKALRYWLFRELDGAERTVERLGSIDAYFYYDCKLTSANP